MECNKDEATRAKSIAESKLQQKDFLGAKKFTLKAQALYPGLYGISQLLTTLDVYLSAENKISGQVDWYRVLGVNPSDDYDIIKKQYKKLALMLHPDKNTSVGADGAFQLVSEAWRLLSDKEKRAIYNQRRGYKGLQQNTGGPSAPCRPQQQKVPVPPRPSPQKVPSASPRRSKKSAPSQPSQRKVSGHTGSPSVQPWPSQQKVSTQMGCTTSNQKSQSKTAKMPKTQNPHHRSDTFWTVCRECNTHFEYLKIYCNHTLLCRRCEKPFLALEIAPPVKFSKSAKPVPWVRQEHSFKNMPGQNAYEPKGNVAAAQKPGAGQTSPTSFTFTNYQQGPLPETANTAAEKPGNVVQQAHDNLKRSHASADSEKCFKKGKLDDDRNGYGKNHNMAQGNFGTEVAHGAGFYGFSGTCSQPSSAKELPPLELRKLLVLNTQKEIQKKLSDSRL
ncbi:uncharacterized protein LOC130993392 [Salvia miltiorrhiza]|uniref:uncharacterized protein LOC130993392 n=1 Tax=Salvia miltiorrhiza TaxID=226208 RepID=UPI0025AB5E80|nr:uncharacterized protein LOC130993392 [Salvia miltiorrhiza]